MPNKTDKINLSDQLEKLSEIANWFDQQEQVDVEEGLKKVKEAALLIKASKKRLAEVENEFEEIKKNITDEVEENGNNAREEVDTQDVKAEDIPF